MDILTKQDENKQANERFLRAFEYLRKSKGLTQAQFSKILGTNSSLISLYKSGKKRVGDDIIDRLLMASKGKIYRRYITGKSDYMLIENVSDEQFLEDERRENNPDYSIMQPQKANSQAAEPASDYVALPTWADALIQMVTEQVKANEDMRRELRQSLEEVASLKQELQNAINNLKS